MKKISNYLLAKQKRYGASYLSLDEYAKWLEQKNISEQRLKIADEPAWRAGVEFNEHIEDLIKLPSPKVRMNFCPFYNFIFIHIPKNAGNSLHATLDHNFTRPTYGHVPILEIKKNLMIHSPKIWNESFKFSIIRNPWDRFVSLYGFFNSMGPGHPFYQAENILISKKIKSYKSFRNSVLNIEKSGLLNNYSFYTQSYWILDEDNNILTDFSMRFETIEKDWQHICNLLKLPRIYRDFKHVNTSSHNPYRELYDNETQEIIGEIYKKDVEKFGYNFN